MYTSIHMEFGKRFTQKEGAVHFVEEEIEKLSDLNLFNYTMKERELGEIFYPVSYGGNQGRFGVYLIVVRSGDKQALKEAKDKLRNEALNDVKELIEKEQEIYKLLENSIV